MNRERKRARLWLPALLVALGAGVVTAHGLFEVAHGAGVPAGLAAVYPLITDGLALVAYAATTRLEGGERRYAWVVVVLAAGLSGLAQASYLAETAPTQLPANPAAEAEAPAALRFGVGAWPAVAAAIVAHLLYLIATGRHRTPEARPDTQADDEIEPSAHRPAPDESPAAAVRPSVQQSAVHLDPVRPDAVRPDSEHPAAVQRAAVQLDARDGSGSYSDASARSLRRPSVSGRPGEKPGERARRVAEAHVAEHGVLPTVTTLQAAAQVSRGTAGEAIKALRPRPAGLHIVPLNDESSHQS